MTLDMVIGLAVLAVAATIFVVYPLLVVSGMCSEAERQAEIMALQAKAEREAASGHNDGLSPLANALSNLPPAPGGGGPRHGD